MQGTGRERAYEIATRKDQKGTPIDGRRGNKLRDFTTTPGSRDRHVIIRSPPPTLFHSMSLIPPRGVSLSLSLSASPSLFVWKISFVGILIIGRGIRFLIYCQIRS